MPAGSALTDPESIIDGVIAAVAELREVGVDGVSADQGLVVQVIAPDRAGMGVAAIEILPVVGHVTHKTIGVGDPGDVELLEEVAVHIVFIEHRKDRGRLAVGAGVDVLAVIDDAVLAASGAGERSDKIPHVGGTPLLGIQGAGEEQRQNENDR